MVSVSLATTTYPTTRSWDRTAWPHDAGRRWSLRLICGLPLVAIALGASEAGYASPEIVDLANRAATVREGEGLDQLSSAYPPIPTLLTAVLPGGTTGISVLSAISGGYALQLVLARLVRRKTGIALGAALIAALVCSPIVWFQATQNPSQFMALMFLVVAIDGFIRFIVREDTAGGFASGLALSGAFLCDPIGLVYAIAIAASGPMLAKRRGFNRRNRAATLVLIFPTLSMLLSWAFLEWRFSGSAFATVWATTDAFRFSRVGIEQAIIDAISTVAISILFLTVGIVVVRRRPRAAATLAVPLFGMVLAAILGFPFTPGLGLVLLTVVALYTVPRRLNVVERLVLCAAAIGQVGLTLTTGVGAEDVRPFLDVLV